MVAKDKRVQQSLRENVGIIEWVSLKFPAIQRSIKGVKEDRSGTP